MNITTADIKLVKSLKDKKFRDETGLFAVEGEKLVEEARRAEGFEVERIWRKEEIGENAMSRITMLSTPSPVLALVKIPERFRRMEQPEEFIGAGGLWLGLDTIRDPGNMGTIIRMADWFGLEGIVAAPDSVDIFNPKVVQATMGAIFRVNFHYAFLTEAARAIHHRKGKVYGTFLDGTDIYATHLETGTAEPVMVVTGNESRGISPEVEAVCDGKLYIPPYPADRHGSESLNAAVATSIVLAEFRRRPNDTPGIRTSTSNKIL